MNKSGFLWVFVVFMLISSGCAKTYLNRAMIPPDNYRLESQYLNQKIIKIHVTDGSVYILNNWEVIDSSNVITGYGSLYNYKRELIADKKDETSKGNATSDKFMISQRDISLIEVNKVENNTRNMTAVNVIGVPSAALSLYCLTNPKACFGSCPTFYVMRDGNWALISEGFSSSISSAYEETDYDMLYQADENSGNVTLMLTNEALETHIIRYIDLLAFPENFGELVFATEDGVFYRTSTVLSPESCVAEEGDCLNLVKEADRTERYSLAGPDDLSEKEEITMTFKNPGQSELGLLIGSKQTLLTTYLFYQVMAYTGSQYGTLVSRVENGDTGLTKRIQNLWDELGGIEIFLQNEKNNWEKVGEITEMGPIASDIHLVKLPPVQEKSITLKLRLTKGLWRLDYLSLAEIVGEETPVRIQPSTVLKDDTLCTEAMNRLLDKNQPLVTFPGDRYELNYELPGECTWQLFLETKGYYLEWMRQEWLDEENIKKAAFAFYFPSRFMKKAAPAFKLAEPQMEKIFWESRYVRQ